MGRLRVVGLVNALLLLLKSEVLDEPKSEKEEEEAEAEEEKPPPSTARRVEAEDRVVETSDLAEEGIVSAGTSKADWRTRSAGKGNEVN